MERPPFTALPFEGGINYWNHVDDSVSPILENVFDSELKSATNKEPTYVVVQRKSMPRSEPIYDRSTRQSSK